MTKKRQFKIIEGQNFKKRLDINAFIKALNIPQVHDIMYHHFEAAKMRFQDEISNLDESPSFVDWGDNDGKIISLTRNDYYATSTPEKLKEFFQQVLANPELQKAVLEDYYFVYKPILKLDVLPDFVDERVAISN